MTLGVGGEEVVEADAEHQGDAQQRRQSGKDPPPLDLGEKRRGEAGVAAELDQPPMPDRALPPVLVLVSDGQPTDDFQGGLRELLGKPWGGKAIRMAIAIGRDADQEVLQKFINHSFP